MKNTLIKVDRVATVEEALNLERLGTDIITVSLEENPTFDDNRLIELKQARLIRNSLSSAKLAGDFHTNFSELEVIQVVDEIGLNYVQHSWREKTSYEFMKALEMKNVGTIYSDFIVNLDSDGCYLVTETIKEEDLFNGSYYQVDLLGYANAWETLKELCPQYPGALQLKDLHEVSRKYPLSLILDYSPENFAEIFDYLPNIKAAAFVISDNHLSTNSHCFRYTQIVDIISKINYNTKK